MTYRAEVASTAAGTISISATGTLLQAIERTGATEIELRLIDTREHSKDQHGKVFALCSEISKHSGHERGDLINWAWISPEEVRYALTDDFCAQNGLERFSMANVDMETCRDFITYLVDFCLHHNVETKYPLGQYAEDAERYIYACLFHRRCSICGRAADVHHIDAIGMGGNRNDTVHIGRRAIALCREHHAEAHTKGVNTFFDLYHLPRGIRLNQYLCARLGLPTDEADQL